MSKNEPVHNRAVALMSGGLDSNIAVKMLHDAGIEIIGVHFTGPFCMCNRGSGGCIHYAKKLASEIGIKFHTFALGNEYLDIVVHPKHGRGSGMNPCLDCRIMMMRRAKQMMDEEGASFIVTGEVLGQRPMSQLSPKLQIIEKESGLDRLILRPLSAKNLPETIPEKEGWVDREKLLDIQGRSRKPQIDLAESLEIGDYPCPAGGCLLTDKNFSRKLRDHLTHGQLEMKDLALLKMGRHFRLDSQTKLVVGRDEKENESIERQVRSGDTLLLPDGVMGPSALIRALSPSDEMLKKAGGIAAGYCDGEGDVRMTSSHDEETGGFTCERIDREKSAQFKI